MSTKRKVQFNPKKKVKKFSRDADEEISESDEDVPKEKPKHSLDSDEEDNEKYELLNRDCLNGNRVQNELNTLNSFKHKFTIF